MDPRGQNPHSSSSNEGYHEPRDYHYSLSMEGGAGTCHMASSFYEILQESGLREQLVNGWGHAYSDRSATSSSSPPTSDAYEGGSQPSRRSQPRQSQKSSSPSSSSSSSSTSRRKPQKRDDHGSSTSKSSERQKKSRASNIKEEDREEGKDGEAKSRSGKHIPTADSREPKQGYSYSYSVEDYGSPDCFGGLNAEINTLRMHLLQRANGTPQVPQPANSSRPSIIRRRPAHNSS